MSEVAREKRDLRQRWAAPGSSHDRVVTLSRIILPTGIGVLAAFLVMAPLTMGGDVSFVLDKSKVAVAKERMRTQSAMYRGEDAEGQAFSLNAGSAVQKSSSEPIVELNQLAARIQLTDGPARLNAESGRYNMQSERVAVDGPIRFEAADGYRLDTQDATVDLKTRRLASDDGVSGTLPAGRFSAETMRADLEDRTVVLEGRARLRIVPNRPK